jgi:hypothetical protein
MQNGQEKSVKIEVFDFCGLKGAIFYILWIIDMNFNFWLVL